MGRLDAEANAPSEAATSHDCCGVRLTESAVSELDGERPMLTIKRAEIRTLALCRGIAAERPVATLLFGTVVAAVGLVFARAIVFWVLHGGLALKVHAYGVGLLPLGGWLVHYAVRKRYYLRVTTASDVRKLAFNSKATGADVRAFARLIDQAGPFSVRLELDERAR